MQIGGERQSADDRFIFVGCGTKERKGLIYNLRDRFVDIEILAPVEKRMIRPRRKSSKRKALVREVPLFFEYLAVNFEPMVDDWHWLLRADEVRFVLLGNDLEPKVAKRRDLRGLLCGESLRSWEGAIVEFTKGPFIGQRGKFNDGRVDLGPWGKTKVNVFDLVRVA